MPAIIVVSRVLVIYLPVAEFHDEALSSTDTSDVDFSKLLNSKPIDQTNICTVSLRTVI